MLAKADAGYVEEMFKSLSASMESQLHELRQAAESGVAGAAEELEAQSEKWAALQAELLDKAGRDDLRALEQQMLGKLNRVTKRLNSQSGGGHPGGGTEAGASSKRRGRQSDGGGGCRRRRRRPLTEPAVKRGQPCSSPLRRSWRRFSGGWSSA
eukprot:COSAG01_NODE_15776_length_1300_cov_16.487094_3_plen_154_part_00